MHNSLKWAVLGARFDPEVAIHLAPVLAFAREVWANGMRRKHGYEVASDALDGVEIWKVQKQVMVIMAPGEAIEVGQASPGPSLGRLARSLAYFGARFTKAGHLQLRCGGETDLSICSPRLLEGKVGAGKGTGFGQ